MVLTRSMATPNNIQGDEPCATALQRQVQSFTAAVERLTKQNHDLEEQLYQKNAGHNTQEEDQKAPMLREEIKKGQKVAMSQAD